MIVSGQVGLDIVHNFPPTHYHRHKGWKYLDNLDESKNLLDRIAKVLKVIMEAAR